MNKYAKRYLIDAMSGMAQGLFASLLIGTIIKTLGQQLLRLGDNSFFSFLVAAGSFAAEPHVVGAAMAVGIGYAMQLPALVLFSLVAVGAAANVTGGAGGPLAVLFIAIIAAELGNLVSKKTKVDIIVTPAVTILVGSLLTVLFAKHIGAAAASIGHLVVWATKLRPFVMGIIVAVVIGVALTLPISSAAICAAFGLTGLAGGAAVAGCCAQMVGFAVLSFRENKWGGLLSQGLGTSMLQMPNIIKNPKVWLPPILDISYHRSNFNLPFQNGNERPCSKLRNGNLRTCRSDWRCKRLVFSKRSCNQPRSKRNSSNSLQLAWSCSYLLCFARPPHMGIRPPLPPHRLD